MPSQSTDELTHIEDLIIAYGKLPTEANRTRIMHLINSEVLSVLDELESKSTQEFPMSSGDNIPFIPLSAMQTLKEKYQ